MGLPELVCPRCRTPFDSDSAFDCPGCGTHYAREDGSWDLAPWLQYADVETAPAHAEESGERTRTERFYLPLLRGLAERTGRSLGELRVLDDGCGWGAAVERLHEEGVDGVGIDVGYRRSEWARRTRPEQFLRAD